MEGIISWSKDNFYNDKCLKVQEDDHFTFKPARTLEDGTVLLRIHKSCLFSCRTCTVSTLFDKDEEPILMVIIGFIYEMFVFGPEESQWFKYLSPYMNQIDVPKKEPTDAFKNVVGEWEKKFNTYYKLWNKEFNWSMDASKEVSFKDIALTVLNSATGIDSWVGPCLLPGGITQSHNSNKDSALNTTLLSVGDVCSTCGEEVCGCDEISGDENKEQNNNGSDDNEMEVDDSDLDLSSDGESEGPQGSEEDEEEDDSEEEESDENDMIKPGCITIVAGNEDSTGNITSLEENTPLIVSVLDPNEMYESNLFNNGEENPQWFETDGNPSHWLLYQLDPLSKLSDKELKTKLRHLIISKMSELQKEPSLENEDDYIILRNALRQSYQ